jgi:flagellar hook-associated protein 2
MSVSSSSSSTSQQLGYLNTAQTLSALLGTTDTALSSLESSQPISISGLSSGINSSEIVAELMKVAAQPQAELQAQLNSASTVLATYQSLSSDIATLQSVSDTLESPSGWQAWIPNSTTEDATATVGSGAIGGSITFSVDQLAQADSMISSGSVSSESAQITSGPLLVAVGGGGLGIGTLSSTNLSIGNHTIAVTQASSGASLAGSTAPAPSTTITTGSNDTLNYTLNGTAETLTIAAGTYTPSQLATAVQSASGGNLSASINSSGDMVLTTTAQGSTTSFQVTGGDAASALGFSTTPSSTASGTDGIITVDGVSNTVTGFTPGTAIALNGANGSTVSATFTGPLVVGSLTTAEVNTGNGSLQSVVSAINSSGIGITASAVTTGQGQYNLSLQSNSSGAANTINIDPGAFSGAGQLVTVTSAQNAEVTVGTGPGAFQVTNDSNTISGLMQGVTIDLQAADPSHETTISLQPDGQTMASTIQTLVTAANQLITDLNAATQFTQSSSSSTSPTIGPLLGDPTAEGLLQSALSAMSGAVGVNSSGSAGALGITMNSDGTLSFNSAKFAAAYDANPTAVANTFTSGGTSSSPLMSFYESSDATAPGTYQVNVTHAASQATDTSSLTAGTVTTAETLTIASGSSTATYTTAANETYAQVAAGLNQALAKANVAVNAEVVNGALQLTSMAYGSSASFSVTSTATGTGTTGLANTPSASQTYTGTDVQGTIDGKAATGAGQLLLGATGSAAQGLLVDVNATASQLAAQSGGTLSGSITYSPGMAQALAHVAYAAGNPANGTLVSAISGEQSQMTGLQQQITAWNPILQAQQIQLQDEYNAMETSLAALKSTQSYLNQFMNLSSSSSSGSSSGG